MLSVAHPRDSVGVFKNPLPLGMGFTVNLGKGIKTSRIALMRSGWSPHQGVLLFTEPDSLSVAKLSALT